MSRFIDMTDQKVGRLKVLCRVEDHIYPSGRHDIVYRCKCECGNIVDVLGIHLRSGHTQSCGCFRRDVAKENNTIHGMTDTRLHNIWRNMKSRCLSITDPDFPNYGGRGITICQDWINDFTIFMSWAIWAGYNDTLTLDRIDVNGNYEPDNCRWVTQKIQCNNTRVNIKIQIGNEIHTLKEWCELLNKNYGTVHSRIFRGWNPTLAILY